MDIRVLSAEDVKKALPMAQAIEGMKQAFAQLSTGKTIVPLRNRVDVPGYGVSLFMPAYLGESRDLAVKVVSVFGDNPKRGLPTIHGLVLVLEAETGRPLSLMEGGTLTAIRTGAGSGAATDLLSRPDAKIVAIIGSGVQARTQLEAVCTVRAIEKVYVYSPNQAHAQAFAQEMAGVGPIPADIEVVEDINTAVSHSHIICTATTSHTPVFDGHALQPGAHLNGVGSFTPAMIELDQTTILRSLVIADSREVVWEEAGELITLRQQGIIHESYIHAELGELVAGFKPGRTSPNQITFFKSCGVAVQDAAAARIALQNAIFHNLGTLIDL